MPYTHITQEDRVVLAALLRAGHSQADIVRQIGKDRSSVCRELARNYYERRAKKI